MLRETCGSLPSALLRIVVLCVHGGGGHGGPGLADESEAVVQLVTNCKRIIGRPGEAANLLVQQVAGLFFGAWRGAICHCGRRMVQAWVLYPGGHWSFGGQPVCPAR